MTPRENFFRMVHGDGPERLPLDIWLAGPMLEKIQQETGQEDAVEALGLDFRHLHPRFPDQSEAWRRGYAAIGIELPKHAEVGFAGITHVRPPLETMGNTPHLARKVHPLRELRDVKALEELPWPDTADSAAYAHLGEAVAATREEGRVSVGWTPCTTFESAWALRGMDTLLLDMADGNAVGNWLLDWFTQRSLDAMRAWCAAGVDIIHLGDDVGTQRGMLMSVMFWRQHLKPRLAKVIQTIRQQQRNWVAISYHSDGDIRPILPDLVELGVDMLNPVQPECMPHSCVVPNYSSRIAFWGMIGTQTTMPFGSPDDVREEVRKCADWARVGARIVLAPTHYLEPDVPWENVQALVDEVHRIHLERPFILNGRSAGKG